MQGIPLAARFTKKALLKAFQLFLQGRYYLLN